jgi:hypothetical protein
LKRMEFQSIKELWKEIEEAYPQETMVDVEDE